MMRNDLVVFSLEPWDDVWRRNQYLIDGLLRGDETLRVLFVEPSADIGHALLSRRVAERGRGLRTHPGYAGRLALYQPTKLLPRVLGPFADHSLRRQLHAALRGRGIADPALWVNDASWAGLLRHHDWPALYDVTDDWTVAERPERELRRLLRNEALLMERAQEVVVCSPALQESRRARRGTLLIPNAVELTRYRLPVPRPADLPEGPVALYAGTLHEDRLDVDLTVRTAGRVRESGGTLVMLGPSALSPAHANALRESGALLLGSRPFGEVPGYLQHATVLVVPHAVNEFTDSLDPIKLYEYRAVGRPVVSTAVAGFRDAEDVDVASVEDFPATVVRVLREDRAPLRLDVPDWSDRVAAMTEVVDGLRQAIPGGAAGVHGA